MTYFGVRQLSEKFWDYRRSGSYPKKGHFAVYIIFRNRLLICEVREILSKIDSRIAQFGVRTDTPQAVKVIQVGPGGPNGSVLIRDSDPSADSAVGKVSKNYKK